MFSTRTRRAAIGTAAAGLLAAAATAVPAHAAGISLQLRLPNSLQIPLTPPADPASDSNSLLEVSISSTGGSQIDQAKLTFDASALAGIADFHAKGSTCTAQGAVTTCTESHLPAGGTGIGDHLWLTAAPGVKPGTTGVLHVALSSAEATGTSADLKVTVGGPDLKLKDFPQVSHAKPGDTLSPVVEVANLGQLPTSKLYLEFVLPDGLAADQRAANCVYADVPATVTGVLDTIGSPRLPAETVGECIVDAAVAPGEVYRIDPVKLGVTKTAFAVRGGISVFTTEDARNAQYPQWNKQYKLRAGTGTPLTATKITDDALLHAPRRSGDNLGDLEVSADNTANFVALGSWAPQGDGKQGTLSVGLRNDGPASIIYGGSGDDPADLRVVLPQGSTVTKSPADCYLRDKASPLVYICRASYMVPAGSKTGFDFQLQVDPSTAPTAQAYLVSAYELDNAKPSTLSFDPNPADNSVQVSLVAQPSGSTVSPTPSASRAGSTGAAASPTASAPREDSTDPAVVHAGDDGTGLAFTGGGSNAGVIAAIGGGLAVVGGGAVFYATRRRKADNGG
ncbi:hypothetical protein [Kitasatospora azatica]|uniref:hypothetical protein n=1 Tax=Kitasatospora azatica TaxID=58347 RepID=UPI000560B8CA|nr:hypothetical protein [Kitasatospora azatica]